MKFADVIGHEEIKAVLRRSVDEGRISHAQIFSGECGWGVLPLALAYAQYVNCTNRHDGDSCGECPSCRKSAELMHPDVHYFYPYNVPDKESSAVATYLERWRKIIGTTGGYFGEQEWYDEIKMGNKQGLISRGDANEIIKKLSYKSFEAEYKIVIIWLPERMNASSANTLLKILEEPWDKTLFLMVSQSPQSLLPTIISRVQQTEVPRIDEDSLCRQAELLGADRDRAVAAAHMADGDLIMLRRIMSGEQVANENFERFASLMRLCYADKHLELMEWADMLSKATREEQKEFFEYSLGMLRECYMISAGLENIGYLWGEEKVFGKRFAPFIGNHNIELFVDEMEKALFHIKQNGNAKIVLTHFVLSVSKYIVRKK